jgi:hypothetical protein
MSNHLNRLVGMTVTEIDETDGSLGLRFNGCTFRSFTEHTCSAPLRSLVGMSVRSVSHALEQELSITFSNGSFLSVSLAPHHYTGPEAFVAQFSDGICVVQ